MSERLGIKFGNPISDREYREIERLDQDWHREVVAYMGARGVSFDEAFVSCGGTIIPDTLSKEATRGEAA